LGNLKSSRIAHFQLPNYNISQLPELLHFLMRRMLPAAAAELLQLQPVRSGLPVLGGRIIPLFALTALQRNNLSGHENRSWLLASSSWPLALRQKLEAKS
jgi:hypothetical protein